MSAAADIKCAGTGTVRALQQKRWTDTIGATVGSALLPS
jgi:hypothetical protein